MNICNQFNSYIHMERKRAKMKDEEDGGRRDEAGEEERKRGREKGETNQPSMVINTATESTVSKLNCAESNLFF